MATEFKQIIQKFMYRIEAKPGGGFIAYSKDPGLTPIEGATRSEIDRKIQDSIAADLGAHFPQLKPMFDSQQARLSYHIEAKPDGGYLVRHNDASPGDAVSANLGHEPIEGPTREHVENMVESRLISMFMKQFPPEIQQQITDKINAGGLDVTINRKMMFSPQFEAGPASTNLVTNANFPQPGAAEILPPEFAGTNESPITYEKRKGGSIFRFLVTLAILAVVMYFLSHRR